MGQKTNKRIVSRRKKKVSGKKRAGSGTWVRAFISPATRSSDVPYQRSLRLSKLILEKIKLNSSPTGDWDNKSKVGNRKKAKTYITQLRRRRKLVIPDMSGLEVQDKLSEGSGMVREFTIVQKLLNGWSEEDFSVDDREIIEGFQKLNEEERASRIEMLEENFFKV